MKKMEKTRIYFTFMLSLLLIFVSIPPVLAQDNGGEEEINLALHQPYSVTSSIVDSSFHQLQTASFPDDGTKLTDGVIGPNSWKANGPWVGYLRQDDHQVTLDLGSTQTIHELHAWFLQDKASGIFFPQEVSYEVSHNGNAWMKVGDAPTSIPNSQAGLITQDYSIDGLNVAAQYVRLTFHADVYVFISEFQVLGLPGEQPGALHPTPTPPDKPAHYNFPLAGSKQAGGKKAEVLIYSGFINTPGLPQWTADDLIPFVAYVDEEQQIKDTLFDSFLFMPFASAPSGASYEANATKEDWRYFADQLFASDLRLGGLEQAVSQVEEALNKELPKAPVVFAIPYPGVNSNWGDGLDFNPAVVGEEQSLVNRTQAVQWYVDYIISKWQDAGYTNLELGGFYWYKEGIGYAVSTKDEDLVRNTANIVHQAGPYTFDWIPANQNQGFQNWQEYGFDTALMQPNYAFDYKRPADRLANNAFLARKYGMGVEMEMHWFAVRTDNLGKIYRDNYYDYLDAAYEFHYQNSFLAWYLNTDTLLISARSANAEIRELYDQTYYFIKGTYRPASSR